jgi:hypothetical protein
VHETHRAPATLLVVLRFKNTLKNIHAPLQRQVMEAFGGYDTSLIVAVNAV